MRIFYKPNPSKPTIIDQISRDIRKEIAAMVDILPSSAKDDVLLTIIDELEALFVVLKEHLRSSIIFPSTEVAVSDMQFSGVLYNRALRIGFYPISANPIHWGHLLVALSAIANNKLDKVVFVIAGADPSKPQLAPVDWRHAVTKEMLSKFAPLFQYSDIAKNGNIDGETNIFKVLSLNPFQKIDAFYIVGTDHYYRLNPQKNKKDTIEKLEENIQRKIFGYNDLLHSISVIFAKRHGGSDIPVDTSLHVGFISCLKFEVSSTMIREAFKMENNGEVLALLPHTIYQSIIAQGKDMFFRDKPRVEMANS